MKTLYQLSLLIFAIFLFASCSAPVHVQQDNGVNLSSYRTYSWVETHSDENDKTARAMSYADIPVHNAATPAFQAKGWSEVTENPDLVITYDVIVERAREQRSDPVYSQPFTRAYYNPYARRWGYIYYPSQFMGYQNYSVPVREGTVTITITDARTDKTVWQGWTTERMNYNRFSESQLEKATAKILRKLNSQR